MAFHLPTHISDKLAAARAAEMAQQAVFATLDDADLAASAQFWMQHCDAPTRIEPGRPVYDSTFWHVIAPEMIRRLRDRRDP